MSPLELLLLLLVAGICGSIAQSLAGYTHGGCLVSIMLGFIGALLGMWLARLLGLPELVALQIGDQPFPVIWSIIGAALFVALLRLMAFSPVDMRYITETCRRLIEQEAPETTEAR